MRRGCHDEITAGGNMPANLRRNSVVRQVEHCHTNILNLCGDGIPEQHYQHYGINQQDKHGAPVAQDMAKLLVDKRNKPSHII